MQIMVQWTFVHCKHSGLSWPRSLANISITNCWINKPQWRRCRTQDTHPARGRILARTPRTVTFNIILLNTTSLLHPFPLLFWAVLSFYYLWRFITLQHIASCCTPPNGVAFAPALFNHLYYFSLVAIGLQTAAWHPQWNAEPRGHSHQNRVSKRL